MGMILKRNGHLQLRDAMDHKPFLDEAVSSNEKLVAIEQLGG